MGPNVRSFRTGAIIGLVWVMISGFFRWYGSQASGTPLQLNIFDWTVMVLTIVFSGLIGMGLGWLRRRLRR